MDVTKRERLERWQAKGGNWWLAKASLEVYRLVHRVKIGSRTLDWVDLSFVDQLGWRNRHDARRWARTFRAAALVAHDAMLEGRRVKAIQWLCEVVPLEGALRLTSTPQEYAPDLSELLKRLRESYGNVPINITNSSGEAYTNYPEPTGDDRVDAFVYGMGWHLDFERANRVDEELFDRRIREHQVEILAEQFRVRLGLRTWEDQRDWAEEERHHLTEYYPYSQLVGRRTGQSTRDMLRALAEAEIAGHRRVFVEGRGNIAIWSVHTLQILAQRLGLNHEINRLPTWRGGRRPHVLYVDHALPHDPQFEAERYRFGG
jgi:hypothetical protein